MPTKRGEQAPEIPVTTGRELAESLERAVRIRAVIGPVLLAAKQSIKKMDEDFEANGGKRQPLYWELKKVITPLQNLKTAADAYFSSEFLRVLNQAGEDAVEAYRAERRKKRTAK